MYTTEKKKKIHTNITNLNKLHMTKKENVRTFSFLSHKITQISNQNSNSFLQSLFAIGYIIHKRLQRLYLQIGSYVLLSS